MLLPPWLLTVLFKAPQLINVIAEPAAALLELAGTAESRVPGEHALLRFTTPMPTAERTRQHSYRPVWSAPGQREHRVRLQGGVIRAFRQRPSPWYLQRVCMIGAIC